MRRSSSAATISHLEELPKAAGDRPKLIAFESIYSMDGDAAPINAICDLAQRYGAMTYLDEVHEVGTVSGRAVAASPSALGKVFGALGGYIAAKAALVRRRFTMTARPISPTDQRKQRAEDQADWKAD